MPHRRYRRAATAALFAVPLTLATPVMADAATGASASAGLLPPLPGPVASLLPAPVSSTVDGLLGQPTASATASPTAAPSSPAANPIDAVLSAVAGVLALPTVSSAPSPSTGGSDSLVPGAASLPGVKAAAAAPLRTQAVEGLVETATHATSHSTHAAAHEANPATAAEPATGVALPAPAQLSLGTVVAAPAPPAIVAKPAFLPVQVAAEPAAVAAHEAKVTALQKRQTEQVSDGLAAAAFAAVALAGAGQVAARRRKRNIFS